MLKRLKTNSVHVTNNHLSLKLMVVTRENVAAHAIAEHLVALQLLEEVQQLMGRLVGHDEQ